MATQPALLLSPADVAQLSPADRAAYLNGKQLSPIEQAALTRAMTQQRHARNAQYMGLGVRGKASCPNANGPGITQNYTAGQTLIWNIPQKNSGWVKGIWITANLTVACAAGTGGAYVANAGAPYNVFGEFDVNYNGPQWRMPFYFIKPLSQMFGFQRPAPGVVIAGSSDSQVQAFADNGVTTNVGNNTWAFKVFVPFNMANERLPYGMLPMYGTQGSLPQVKLFCQSTSMGNDPLTNPVATTAGTGVSVTITGTVQVDCEYLDSTNYAGPDPLTLDITGDPTVQVYWDSTYQPWPANTLQRVFLQNKNRHFIVMSVLIDAQLSTKFCAVNNFVALEFAQDNVGSDTFWKYALDTNVSIQDYFMDKRRVYGQDLDAGVIVWLDGPTHGLQDPSSHDSGTWLDMRKGWPSASIAAQVTTIGALAGVTPRLETIVVTFNDDGLRVL